MHLKLSAYQAEEFLQCTDIGVEGGDTRKEIRKYPSVLPSKKFEETPSGRNATRSVFANIKVHFIHLYCWALLRRK
jgi:hypothetical protein